MLLSLFRDDTADRSQVIEHGRYSMACIFVLYEVLFFLHLSLVVIVTLLVD